MLSSANTIKTYADTYGAIDSSIGVNSDTRTHDETNGTIHNRLYRLSEEAYGIIFRESTERGISIVDVILEKARDRVIQPDVLDELEQKAVEDKFSKIPKLDIK